MNKAEIRRILMLAVLSVFLSWTLAACANAEPKRPPNADEGRVVFESECSQCHTTTRRRLEGPGLLALMKRNVTQVLPNLMPPNEAGVRSYLLQTSEKHSSFSHLTEQQMDDLIAYLKTL